MMADHKVPKEESEPSCLQHRYSVVDQDFSSGWGQCYPTQTQSVQETMKSLQDILPPDQKPGIIHIHYSLFLKIYFFLGIFVLGSRQVNATPAHKPTELLKKTQSLE